MLNLALAVSCAALYVLSFAPFNLAPLAFVSLWPFCVLVRRTTARGAFAWGYVTGVLLLTAGNFWLRKAHPLNLLLMVASASFYFAWLALGLRWMLVRKRWPSTLALPLAFVVQEFARSHVPLDGYPWLLLGYTQVDTGPLLLAAGLAGVYGVSLVVALVAGVLDDLWSRRRELSPRVRIAGLAVAVAVVGSMLGYGLLQTPRTLAEVLRVGLVQPNIPQELKTNHVRWEDMLDKLVGISERAVAAAPTELDLVIWPETMLPHVVVGDRTQDVTRVRSGRRVSLQAEESELLKQVMPRLHGRGNAALLTGALGLRARGEEIQQQNSAILYDAAGRHVAEYHKSLLVPGGEYIPYLDLLPGSLREWLTGTVAGMAGFLPDLLPGEGPGVMALPSARGPVPAGITICYENVYPHYGATAVRAGAALLINLSNEAWFPGSAEYAQYHASARFRAAETRRTLLRSANSGISAIIDPWGRTTVLEVGGEQWDVEGFLVGDAPLCADSTLYVRWGDWLCWCCLVGCLGMLVLPFGRGTAAGAVRATAQGNRSGPVTSPRADVV